MGRAGHFRKLRQRRGVFLRLHAALRVLSERGISQENFGKEVSSQELRAAFERLIDEGCQNINLVTPTHFLPSILPALAPKLPVPVVYNCGGYESVETLRALEGLVDIYLPDFKYSDAALAKKLSAAPDYPQIASAAILEMYQQVGGAVIEDEQMTRGVIIRHLVLPGCIDNSLGVLDWIADNFPKKDVLVSLMSQYVPMGRAKSCRPLTGALRRRNTTQFCRICICWSWTTAIRRTFPLPRQSTSRNLILRVYKF